MSARQAVPLWSVHSGVAQCAWVPRGPRSASGFRPDGVGAGNLCPMFESLFGNAQWWATWPLTESRVAPSSSWEAVIWSRRDFSWEGRGGGSARAFHSTFPCEAPAPPACLSVLELCAGEPAWPLGCSSPPGIKSLGAPTVSHLLGTVLGRR